jgi:hypothetical protein
MQPEFLRFIIAPRDVCEKSFILSDSKAAVSSVI